jgi:hypothetical protein
MHALISLQHLATAAATDLKHTQGLSACQVFQARAALAAFDADFLASGEMNEYIGSLSAAAALLDSGRALPPPGEHEGNGK